MSIAERIRRDLEARIVSGEWQPGHRLPFEHELVAAYRCSRATVSKAMAALVQSRLIERRRKAGSFVAMPHVHSAILDIPDIGAQIKATTGAYRFERDDAAPGDHDLADAGFAPNTRLRHICGVHHGASAPFGYEQRLISINAVPLAAASDFDGLSPGAWLLLQTPWSNARHRISAVVADVRQAGLLAISKGAPCLQVERWTWRSTAPITFVRQIFPADRYDLVATFTPDGL